MAEKEMIQRNIEEFSRLQKYMSLTQDKESEAYQEMYERYIDLKAILTASGTNITDIDRIKHKTKPYKKVWTLGKSKRVHTFLL